jgi:hypothetical protein
VLLSDPSAAHASDMHTLTLTNSLLVWGGAPGTTSDSVDHDRDAPVHALVTDDSDDNDDDDDEHIDR